MKIPMLSYETVSSNMKKSTPFLLCESALNIRSLGAPASNFPGHGDHISR